MIPELQNVKLLSLHQSVMKTLIKIITASCKNHRGFDSYFCSALEQKMGTLTLSLKAHRSGVKGYPRLMPFLQGLIWLLAGVGRSWAYSFVLTDYLKGHGPHLGPVTRNLQRSASTRGKHSLTSSTDLAFWPFPMLAFKTRLNSTQSSQSHPLLITNIIQEALIDLKSNHNDSISMKTIAALSTSRLFIFCHCVLIKSYDWRRHYEPMKIENLL